jgi:hypothetical protein
MTKYIKETSAIIILMAFAFFVCSCTPSHPKLSKEEVIALANQEAIRQGYKIDQYETPKSKYEFTEKYHSWTVFYEGKQKDPGNHFTVWVNDQTGSCQLMRGK